MKKIETLSRSEARAIRFLCTDIDDTLTREGKLGWQAYRALWQLKELGIQVIPVTGRPAGWCDLIAREWPVDAVIGENGAFAFYLQDTRLIHQYHPSIAPENVRKQLDEVAKTVFKKVPEARISKDQFSRKFDLAIDFREEPPDLGFEIAEKIAAICRQFGAQAKISSIHVNTWFGSYTKVDMLEYYLSSRWKVTPVEQRRSVFFCGDSPNDEPLFERFPLSCGVANVKETEHLLTHKPGYVSKLSNGEGFVEIAEVIMSLLEKV